MQESERPADTIVTKDAAWNNDDVGLCAKSTLQR